MKKNRFLEIIVIIATGFISGFFGAGGGLLLVPFFIHWLKLDEVKSRANSILIILSMVIVSGIIYLKNNYIDYNLSIKCAIGGIVGSFIGSKLLVCLNKNILNLLFIAFLIYSGMKIVV
ncbi:MAG: sulfite exporter TauE/SafE family protein [Clostridia bacterium]|nr:sulfite exporter TauE/SafE family protein [Clostridia bacterium]